MSEPRSARGAVALVLAAMVISSCGTQDAPSPGLGTSSPAATTPATRPVTSQRLDAGGGLDCPGSIASAEGMTVPQPPQGIDGTARLLPQREPASLVVCSYPVMSVTRPQPLARPFALSERRVLTSELRAATIDLLTWAPRWNGRENVCTSMAGDETAYLVGASYDGAVVWVAARADANTCSRSTNGDFVSGAAVGVPLRELLRDQPLPAGPVPAHDTCGLRTFGRLGDDRSLAPAGDPVVTVCRVSANGQTQPTLLDAARSAAVVAALRGLGTRPTGRVCQGGGKDADRRFALMLTYPDGPPVRVETDPACTPAVLGSALESDGTGELVALVERSSPPIPAPYPNGSVSSGGQTP